MRCGSQTIAWPDVYRSGCHGAGRVELNVLPILQDHILIIPLVCPFLSTNVLLKLQESWISSGIVPGMSNTLPVELDADSETVCRMHFLQARMGSRCKLAACENHCCLDWTQTVKLSAGCTCSRPGMDSCCMLVAGDHCSPDKKQTRTKKHLLHIDTQQPCGFDKLANPTGHQHLLSSCCVTQSMIPARRLVNALNLARWWECLTVCKPGTGPVADPFGSGSWWPEGLRCTGLTWCPWWLQMSQPLLPVSEGPPSHPVSVAPAQVLLEHQNHQRLVWCGVLCNHL